LAVLLWVLAINAERVSIRVGPIRVSAGLVPLVLAMTLLGPAPAAAVGGTSDLMGSVLSPRRDQRFDVVSNIAVTAAFAVAGGLLARSLLGDSHVPHRAGVIAVVVFVVFLTTSALNFILVAYYKGATRHYPVLTSVRRVFVPLLPGQIAAAALAALIGIAYIRFGYLVVGGVALVMSFFQYSNHLLARSQERADLVRNAQLTREQHGQRARARERERWARELHEDTAASLRTLLEQLVDARASNDTQAMARTTAEAVHVLGAEIDGLRHLIAELSPPALSAYGLPAALTELVASARTREGIDATLTIDPAIAFPLPADTERGIFRILQEIVTSAAKRDDPIDIRLVRDGGNLRALARARAHGATTREAPASTDPTFAQDLERVRDWAAAIGAQVDPRPGDSAAVELLVALTSSRSAAPATENGAAVRRHRFRAPPSLPRVGGAMLFCGLAAEYLVAGPTAAGITALVTIPFGLLGPIYIASRRDAAALADAAHATLRRAVLESERERERWAREIHDQTIQRLGAVRLRLASALDQRSPDQLLRAVVQADRDLRAEVACLDALVADVRAPQLAQLGLAAALRALASEATTTELDVEATVAAPDAGVRATQEIETAAYRIAQEALNNIVKHAEATSAGITLAVGRCLELRVADNGRGFVPDVDQGGYGLRSMRARADLAGGDLAIHSQLGRGTTVTVRLPLARRSLAPWELALRWLRYGTWTTTSAGGSESAWLQGERAPGAV
jgi:signal transduction histidine kinase